jgi:hypothetical protein
MVSSDKQLLAGSFFILSCGNQVTIQSKTTWLDHFAFIHLYAIGPAVTTAMKLTSSCNVGIW